MKIAVDGSALKEHLKRKLDEKIRNYAHVYKGEKSNSMCNLTFRANVFFWVVEYLRSKGFAIEFDRSVFLSDKDSVNEMKVRADGKEGVIKIVYGWNDTMIPSEKIGEEEPFTIESVYRGNERYWKRPVQKLGRAYFCDWGNYKALVWVFYVGDDTEKGFGEYSYPVILFPKDRFDVFVRKVGRKANVDYVLEGLI